MSIIIRDDNPKRSTSIVTFLFPFLFEDSAMLRGCSCWFLRDAVLVWDSGVVASVIFGSGFPMYSGNWSSSPISRPESDWSSSPKLYSIALSLSFLSRCVLEMAGKR